MGTVSLTQRFHQLCCQTSSRKRCQRVAVEQPQGRAPIPVGTRTRATAGAAGAASLRGTATAMPMGPRTTTMGQAMASTILHLVEHSLLAARRTPPTTTTMLGHLPPRPNSHFISQLDWWRSGGAIYEQNTDTNTDMNRDTKMGNYNVWCKM